MNIEHQRDYLRLIEALLRCPRGEEAKILNTNRNLINAGLVQAMAQVAKEWQRGSGNTPDSLIHFACKLAEIHFALKMAQEQGLSSSTPIDSPSQAFIYRLPFLLEVLQATTESDGNPEVVYPLLQANLDKLDYITAIVLQSWSMAILAVVQPEEAQSIASYIGKLSALIAQFPRGIRANNLEIAIAGYKMALQAYKREIVPQEWAKIQNNLGIAYTNRIRGERTENLEEAIACCQAALEVLTHEAFPQVWAMAQNNLANAYLDRIRGERAENIEEAIVCCQAALEVYNRDVFPQEWAAVQHNLGSAYYERIQEERTHNLEKAIAYYRAALEVRTREAFPQDWAMTQINLGTTYRDRIDGERAENIEAAIACYQTALQVLTREAFPQEWAMAQSNLGSTYTQRIRGERVQNLEKAITCCRSALEVLNRKAFPQYWAMTQNNLGIAYWERIDGERDRNLEEAIACYQEALEVGTCEAFPFDWAMIQHNLGIAYHDRIRGERTQNQEKAIACYLAALEFRTREAFPQYWAMTQKSLGIAYYDRVRGKRIQNVEKAIVCYQAALEIYTRKAFPKNYAETQFHLGQAYQDARQFAKAYTAFSAAINTVESLRGEIVSGSGVEGDKQKLAEKYNQIYQCVVEVSLELAKDEPQYYNRAIEYVERSKARNLVELLATRDFYPRGDIPQTVLKELDRLRREIAAEQRQIDQSSKVAQQQNLKANGGNYALAVSSNSTRLNALHEQLDNLITREIQPIDPTFSLTQRVEPIRYQQIRDLLPDDQTALIEWYITGNTLITAIITRDTTSPRIWQSTSDDLQSLLNWVDQYLTDYSQQKDQWRDRLGSRLKELADILHLDEIFSYPELEKCDRLILIPHRCLHLFPLHALEVNSQNTKRKNEDSSPASQCLLDLFPGGVSYAPSCQLLQLAQTRQQSNFTCLFALQNPMGNLAYTDVEITAIKCYFKSTDIRKQSAATKVAIHEDCLNKAHCVHFSCHGSFNLDFPLESALELADAPLTLGEIFSLNLERARLVTLSACETGLTDPTSLSDEYIGLPSGFLYARSPNVVSSLWRVSDLSTAFLMIRFYQNMHQGLPVAVALNQAQRWLRDMTRAELEQWIKDNQLSLSPTLRIRQFRGIKANEKPFQSAFHWAAFCAIGQYG